MNGSLEIELKEKVQKWLGHFPHDTPAVVVPVYNAYEDVLECIDSLVVNTPTHAPILVLDDASTDPRIPDALGAFSDSRGFAYVRKPSNSGFVSTVNLAFEWCAPRDVVVVNSDVVVPSEWLERLQAAVYCRPTIATATPLTNHGAFLSVPHRNRAVSHLVEGMTTAQADARIRNAALSLRPITPTAVGHCVYYRRPAFDAVGYFDETFSPGYGEEVDFSQRAVAAGFSHVVADDLFVFHKGSRSFDPEGSGNQCHVRESHENICRTRYPGYHPWVERVAYDTRGPLALSLERARGALLGYRIAVDATEIDGSATGTEVPTLELIRALASVPDRRAHLTMIVADQTPEEALLDIKHMVDGVVRMSELRVAEQPLFDLIHRPSQIRNLEELAFLQQVAHRFIVSHLDRTSFSTASYSETSGERRQCRSATNATFANADGIVFPSDESAAAAERQGLYIPAERACVVHMGLDHGLPLHDEPEATATGIPSVLPDPPVAELQTEATKAEAARFAWNRIAIGTWDFYERILTMPPRRLELTATSLAAIPPGGQTTRGWLERVSRGFQILRNDGLHALLQESRRFVRWLLA